MDNVSCCFLFAYGTLMQGECRFPLLIPGGVISIEQATADGALYHLGSYPGLFRSPDNQPGKVLGELIEFRSMDQILRLLDEEEGVEYRRELLLVARNDGRKERAWCYVLAKPPGVNGLVIASGSWRSC